MSLSTVKILPFPTLDLALLKRYCDGMELAPVVAQQLVNEALKAQEHAYAPYSKFPVGAAILAEDGRVFRGCNVENASFGLTTCAERNALAAAVVAGARPLAIAVVGNQHDLLPCGACRQVLAEFNPDLVVVTRSSAGVLTTRVLRQLLPEAFTLVP
ncbi:MAG: cytidine deaminase [Thermoanaerobaculum sp.]|nr:cytidine deaminase [Thermoanaerobaculum sp.]